MVGNDRFAGLLARVVGLECRVAAAEKALRKPPDLTWCCNVMRSNVETGSLIRHGNVHGQRSHDIYGVVMPSHICPMWFCPWCGVRLSDFFKRGHVSTPAGSVSEA